MTTNDCIFLSPPPSCPFYRSVDTICVGLASMPYVCAQNHRRLMLTDAGKTRALQSFIETILENPDRAKLLHGQAGREL